MKPDFQLAKICAALSARAYDEATIEGPLSTQVLIDKIAGGPMVVAFRGSKEFMDWLTDANALLTDIGFEGMKVHAGFFAAFSGVKEELKQRIPPGTSVIFTGHSLGGALAQLAAWVLKALYPVAAVYTFGEPRIGNKEFAAAYNATLATNAPGTCATFRFVHRRDPVPMLPLPGLFLLPYRHAGNEVFFHADGTTHLNPSLLTKGISNLAALANAYVNDGKVAALLLDRLADHGMQHYLDRVNQMEGA